MATSNSTGASAPDQPTNPFISPGDADGTRQAISEFIAFLNDRWMTELELCCEDGRIDTRATVVSAEMRILDGIGSAVEYLHHLGAVPNDNVTKLEVGHE